jgi:hypothetical protein
MYKIHTKKPTLPSSLHMKLIYRRTVPAIIFVKTRRKYAFYGLKWSPAFHRNCTSIFTHNYRLWVNRRLWRIFQEFPDLSPRYWKLPLD